MDTSIHTRTADDWILNDLVNKEESYYEIQGTIQG